jgi:hypothetical protein
MGRRCGPGGGQTGHRELLPKSIPPELNHLILTGTLTADPRESQGPAGERVTVFEVAFSVENPAHRGLLWTCASYEVEVPGDVEAKYLVELRDGTPVLVSGQLSERIAIEGRRTSRRGVILASLLKPGATPGAPGCR